MNANFFSECSDSEYCLLLAIAVIADFSFFLWDQAPSNTEMHMVLAYEKYKASCNETTLQEAIKKAFQNHDHKDFPDKIVKIALDYRLCEIFCFLDIPCLMTCFLHNQPRLQPDTQIFELCMTFLKYNLLHFILLFI